MTFDKGDPVWYVPDHVDDIEHDDVTPGVVKKDYGPGTKFGRYEVDFEDGSPNWKRTYQRHLLPRDLSD